LYIGWISFFLKKEKNLIIKGSPRFRNKSKVIELINGMQEIKMHNAEKKRWDWNSSGEII
jgi:ATP-binding cassette subfamily B protein